DAGRFKRLAEACAGEKGRLIITTEPQYPKNAPQALAKHLRERNLDVALAEFDTLETAEPAELLRDPANLDADYFLIRVRQNISSLAAHRERAPRGSASTAWGPRAAGPPSSAASLPASGRARSPRSSASTAPAKPPCCGPSSRRFPTPVALRSTAATIIR